MDKNKLISLYEERNETIDSIEAAVITIEKMENYLDDNNTSFKDANLSMVKKYIDILVGDNGNDISSLVALARYFYVINNKEIYIYFTKILGGVGVIENIKKRMNKYAGENITNEVFSNLTLPQLGTSVEQMPVFTSQLMDNIKSNIEPSLYKKILAGNNHRLPKESMEVEKEFYNNSESFDNYLKERHQRKVEELQYYSDNNIVWFEQIINQEVVDYVKSNQEILSGVRKGNKLYVTKIPYDTNGFLKASDGKEKSYCACHCPFARESILDDSKLINGEWCYCSAGFAKFPFEVILDKELDVKVINNALDGDDICRFEIDLKDMY